MKKIWGMCIIFVLLMSGSVSAAGYNGYKGLEINKNKYYFSKWYYSYFKNDNYLDNAANSQDKEEDIKYTVSEYEKEVVDLVNEERLKNGLRKLEINLSLSETAREKSKDMYTNNYFSHISPAYGTPFEMMKKFGIMYKSAGENIAKGHRTPKAVVNAWMNSENHRKNILSTSFTQIGVGYYNGYWTQMFIGK